LRAGREETEHSETADKTRRAGRRLTAMVELVQGLF
jgi:hypothetical protein